jgi:Uma2 family endonuclease
MVVTRTSLSYEEFSRLPEEKPPLEYFYGVVTPKMAPSGPHAILQPELAFFFQLYCRRTGLARVMTELRARWPGVASFVPDVAVYLVERIPTKPNGEVADEFHVPPDVAAEIISPGQSLRATRERARWFVAHGVRVVVIVQPRGRAVYLVRAGGEVGPLRGEDVADLGDVLPGFSFVVRELFAALDVR